MTVQWPDRSRPGPGRLARPVRCSRLNSPGFGPVATLIFLMAWSHHGRIRSEAAFAALPGANPIPASSGNMVRHRLNQALPMVALNQMTNDAETKAYVAKR